MRVELLAALGCPDCPPVREARSLVVSESFWQNVGFALLPFIAIGVAVTLIVHWIDRRNRHE